MCGIVGALSLKKPSIDTRCAQPMTDKISHRGPDDAGYLFFHTGCRHSSKVSFFQHLGDERFAHLSPLLPTLQSRHTKHDKQFKKKRY